MEAGILREWRKSRSRKPALVGAEDQQQRYTAAARRCGPLRREQPEAFLANPSKPSLFRLGDIDAERCTRVRNHVWRCIPAVLGRTEIFVDAILDRLKLKSEFGFFFANSALIARVSGRISARYRGHYAEAEATS
jgi:hypothetical protein